MTCPLRWDDFLRTPVERCVRRDRAMLVEYRGSLNRFNGGEFAEGVKWLNHWEYNSPSYPGRCIEEAKRRQGL